MIDINQLEQLVHDARADHDMGEADLALLEWVDDYALELVRDIRLLVAATKEAMTRTIAAEAKVEAMEKARPSLRAEGELTAVEWEDVQDQAARYSSDSIWRKVAAELQARRAADLSAEDVEALRYAHEHIEPGSAHPKQDEIDIYRRALVLLDRLATVTT